MRAALHPFSIRRITVQDYRQEFGSTPIDRGYLRLPPARCPRCFIGLSIRAEAAVGSVTAHFYHEAGAACDVIEFGRGSFEGLEPRERDRDAGTALRASFQQNWRAHYRVLQELVPKLSVNEFVTLVGRADRQRLWEYVRLPEDLVPYMLVMLADFPPRTGLPAKRPFPGRTHWYRFWFPLPLNDPADLWIRGNVTEHIIRGEFIPPTRGREFPDPDTFDFVVLPIRSGFLATPGTPLAPYIEQRVQEMFTM